MAQSSGKLASGKLALVTGASTGIGYFLAQECANHGYDLIVAADEARIENAAEALRLTGVGVRAVETDLATMEGVDRLRDAAGDRPVDLLLANAGRGLGDDFLDQDFAEARRVVDTNIIGTLYLVWRVGSDMRSRGEGRILITGSIGNFMPGAYQAVYNASEAFLDCFSFALRAELADSGVSVTCLMPGATDTEFFARAAMADAAGAQRKDDPAEVARLGFEAMMRGDEQDAISGWRSKLQSALATVMPAGATARPDRKISKIASPGPARR
jgi:short-subunit dehydrogenase